MDLSKSDFRTTDVTACRDYISRYTENRLLEVPDRAHFSAFDHRATTLGALAIDHVSLTCSRGFSICKSKKSTSFAFQFIERGWCNVNENDGVQVCAQAGDVLVLGPDRLTRAHWSDECRQFVVRIEEETLGEIANDTFNYRKRIEFKSVYRDPGISTWLSEIGRNMRFGKDDRAGLLNSRHVKYHLGQSLVMMLLTGLEHSGSARMLGGDARSAPYYVRRVEKFFERHFAEDITMDKVVEIAGVSARTVFYGFQRWRGTTPMNYLRHYRLDVARDHLLNGRPDGGVSAAATLVGFANFGQFSKIYRERFGEKPSTTALLRSN